MKSRAGKLKKNYTALLMYIWHKFVPSGLITRKLSFKSPQFKNRNIYFLSEKLATPPSIFSISYLQSKHSVTHFVLPHILSTKRNFKSTRGQNYALSSLGTNSLMFANCSVFCDVQHVRSLVLGQNVMFGSVQSSVLLLCDQTSLE